MEKNIQISNIQISKQFFVNISKHQISDQPDNSLKTSKQVNFILSDTVS